MIKTSYQNQVFQQNQLQNQYKQQFYPPQQHQQQILHHYPIPPSELNEKELFESQMLKLQSQSSSFFAELRGKDEWLQFDKSSLRLRISLSSNTILRWELLKRFVDEIFGARHVHIHIRENYSFNNQNQNNSYYFQVLRYNLENQLLSLKNKAQCVKVTYSLTHPTPPAIKAAAGFIAAAQAIGRSNEDTKVYMTYNTPLYNYSGVFQAISTYLGVIAPKITEFCIRLNCDICSENILNLCPILRQLVNAKTILFKCSGQLNLIFQESLEEFIYSFKPALQRSTEHFEFDISESDYKRGVISPISTIISELIGSAGKQLKSVVINMNKVGWTFERDLMIKGELVSGLVKSISSWPQSIQRLTLNLDRSMSFSKNIGDNDVKTLLIGVKQVIQQLESLELNLNGIGFQQKQLEFSFGNELVTLFDGCSRSPLKELDLRISGHMKLSQNDWKRLFSGITNLNKIQRLVLDIERWKNYPYRLMSDSEEAQLLNGFLDGLIRKQKSTLQLLELNIDEWEYQLSNLWEYCSKIMELESVLELQVLWYKSHQILELKPLQFMEDMANKKLIGLLKGIAAQKVGAMLPDNALIDMEEMEEELLKWEVEFYLKEKRLDESFNCP